MAQKTHFLKSFLYTFFFLLTLTAKSDISKILILKKKNVANAKILR